MRIRFSVLLLLASLSFAALAWISGPPSFDAVDGAEFAVAGRRLEIAHSPGYPLFIILLRVFSLLSGPLYGHMRIITCLLAGACLPAAVAALKSHGIPQTAAMVASCILLLLPPVLSQLNVIEIHGTAILLVLLAISQRNRRAGPFLASLAVFGGHPVSVLLFPLALSRQWFSRWAALAVIPASLLLYLPLRAGASTVMHYTKPASLPHAAAYYTMYSGRLQAPSTEGVARVAASVGIAGAGALLVLAAAGGRPAHAAVASTLLGLLFISTYRVPDHESFAWIALLPLSLPVAAGVQRFLRGGGRGILALSCIALSSGLHGITGAWRASDDAAPRYTRDVLSSLPAGAVLHTEGHTAFYIAYMLFNEGYRPDIIPCDEVGNSFFLRLYGTLPDSLGGRPVLSTRAWGDSTLALSGLLFAPEPLHLNWSDLEIYGYDGRSPDAMAGDVAAEAWALRMVQSAGADRATALEKALEHAGTRVTRERVLQLARMYP